MVFHRPIRKGISSVIFLLMFGAYSFISSLAKWDLRPDCNNYEEAIGGDGEAVNTLRKLQNRSLESVHSSGVSSFEPLDEEEVRMAALRFELETSAARSKLLVDNLVKKHEKVDEILKTMNGAKKKIVDHQRAIESITTTTTTTTSTTTTEEAEEKSMKVSKKKAKKASLSLKTSLSHEENAASSTKLTDKSNKKLKKKKKALITNAASNVTSIASAKEQKKLKKLLKKKQKLSMKASADKIAEKSKKSTKYASAKAEKKLKKTKKFLSFKKADILKMKGKKALSKVKTTSLRKALKKKKKKDKKRKKLIQMKQQKKNRIDVIESDKYKKLPVHRRGEEIGWSEDFMGHSKIDFPLKGGWVRPPIEKVINFEKQKIVGDVSGLMDVAVLGQAKCGTTFIQNWLKRHKDTIMFESEECTWLDQDETLLASRLYTQKNTTDKVYGIKCPFEWRKPAIMRFQEHYKNTRLVFGVRHPIRWFKSLYDHKNKWLLPKDPRPMPDASELIGGCANIPRCRSVCTDRANYHQQLAMLGKTPMDEDELELFPFPEQIQGGTVENPLFLYELDQFSDTNETRRESMIHDLENFLGLSTPFPNRGGHSSSGKSDRPKLEICNKEYDELRSVLLEASQRAAWWIRHYLLKSKTVYVSNREHFLELLESWERDPCADGTYA